MVHLCHPADGYGTSLVFVLCVITKDGTLGQRTGRYDITQRLPRETCDVLVPPVLGDHVAIEDLLLRNNIERKVT